MRIAVTTWKQSGKARSRAWSRTLGRVVFYGLMAVGLWLMASASASYLELGDSHPFYLEKLPLAQPTLWLTALYVHVPSALFALPACLVLLSARVRYRFARFHRWLGRITATLIVFAVVPSGMYLAWFAQGGLPSTLGFLLTGLIAWFAMIRSVMSARAGDMKSHRRFSMHVTAQLAVAVFSRFLLVAVEEIGLYSEWAYIAALWVPVVGGVLVSEALAGPRWSLALKGSRHEAGALGSTLAPLRERGVG